MILEPMIPRMPPPITDRHALFLDFDGTLAPLKDNPATVGIDDDRLELLLRLADRSQGAVAIVSERDVRDLADRIPRDLVRIGNHGLYRMDSKTSKVPTYETLPPKLLTSLQTVVASRHEAMLEVKGPVGTIHFGARPEYAPVLIDGMKSALTTFRDYKIRIGKNVVEAVPVGANKGFAIAREMETAPFKGRIPVMVGDDEADEDGFLATQRLGGFGVKVGEEDTVARKCVLNVDAVWDWLAQGF